MRMLKISKFSTSNMDLKITQKKAEKLNHRVSLQTPPPLSDHFVINKGGGLWRRFSKFLSVQNEMIDDSKYTNEIMRIYRTFLHVVQIIKKDTFF